MTAAPLDLRTLAAQSAPDLTEVAPLQAFAQAGRLDELANALADGGLPLVRQRIPAPTVEAIPMPESIPATPSRVTASADAGADASPAPASRPAWAHAALAMPEMTPAAWAPVPAAPPTVDGAELPATAPTRAPGTGSR